MRSRSYKRNEIHTCGQSATVPSLKDRPVYHMQQHYHTLSGSIINHSEQNQMNRRILLKGSTFYMFHTIRCYIRTSSPLGNWGKAIFVYSTISKLTSAQMKQIVRIVSMIRRELSVRQTDRQTDRITIEQLITMSLLLSLLYCVYC